VAEGWGRAVPWSHRRLSRHQRRASGRTAAPRCGSLDPDGWARHSRRRAVRPAPSGETGKRGGTAVPATRGSSSWTRNDDRRRAPPMTYPKVSTDPAEPRNAQGGVPATPRFPQIEERVLAYWEADDTFRASVEQRDA